MFWEGPRNISDTFKRTVCSYITLFFFWVWTLHVGFRICYVFNLFLRLWWIVARKEANECQFIKGICIFWGVYWAGFRSPLGRQGHHPLTRHAMPKYCSKLFSSSYFLNWSIHDLNEHVNSQHIFFNPLFFNPMQRLYIP